MQKNNRPLVGIGVIIEKQDEILLGKRTGSHGENTWSFPGGHLEFGESFFDCAKREVFEETGLIVQDMKKGIYTNDIFEEENLHYITIYVHAKYMEGQPQRKEPHKCLEWKWFKKDNLPKNLFLPIKNLLKEADL